MKKNIIQLSFKESLDDKLLLAWLQDKFEQYGNKSNYIKFILRQEMKKEIQKEKSL